MGALRVELDGPYQGMWMEFDPDVPWWLYDRATAGDPDARREFLRLGILAWSFGPAPRDAPEVLEEIPWDIEAMVPRLFSGLHELTSAEEGDIFQRVWVGTAALSIPELDRFRLCERLGIPMVPAFRDLRAGETLRLVRALKCTDEIEDQKSETKG